MTRRQWMWLWIWLLLFFIIFCVWNKLLAYKKKEHETGTKPVIMTGTNAQKASAKATISKDMLLKITKEGGVIKLSGVFPSQKTLGSARSTLRRSGATVEKGTIIIDKHADNETLRGALPAFARDLKKFSTAIIEYRQHKLTIDGVVHDASVREDINRIVATLGKAYQTENRVTVEKAVATKPVTQKHENKNRESSALFKPAAAHEANKRQLSPRPPAAQQEEKPAKAVLKTQTPTSTHPKESVKKSQSTNQPQKSTGTERKAQKRLNAILKGKRIEFLYASDVLRPKSKNILDLIAIALKKYPHVHIEIAGYTDSDGPAKRNLILSQRRAESVKRYLVKRGISPSRLVAKGYGETHPLVKNDTPAHKQRNRRVEFHIIKEEK